MSVITPLLMLRVIKRQLLRGMKIPARKKMTAAEFLALSGASEPGEEPVSS